MDANTVYKLLDAARPEHITRLVRLLKPYLEMTDQNQTPLQIALINENYELAGELIEGGSNFNVRDELGNTPLHIVAYEVQIGLVELLINLGADINDPNYEKDTAAKYMEVWANKSEKNRLFQLAESKKNPPRLNAMQLHELLSTVRKKELDDVIKSLGSQVIEPDSMGHTALGWATLYSSVLIVEKLIKAGADINRKDKKGESALDFINSAWTETDRKEIYDLIGLSALNVKKYPFSLGLKAYLTDEKKLFKVEKDEIILF